MYILWKAEQALTPFKYEMQECLTLGGGGTVKSDDHRQKRLPVVFCGAASWSKTLTPLLSQYVMQQAGDIVQDTTVYVASSSLIIPPPMTTLALTDPLYESGGVCYLTKSKTDKLKAAQCSLSFVPMRCKSVHWLPLGMEVHHYHLTSKHPHIWTSCRCCRPPPGNKITDAGVQLDTPRQHQDVVRRRQQCHHSVHLCFPRTATKKTKMGGET